MDFGKDYRFMEQIFEILKALLFGVVEGITEWLPVSSTGHMILLNEFVKHGAPEEIYYQGHPHVGSDNLYHIVKNIREEIISLGGKFFFSRAKKCRKI